MRVGFFHDTKIIKGKDGNYYSPSFSYEIWKRYIDVFDNLVVCTRKSEIITDNYEKYRISSGINVDFILNEEYKNPIQFFIDRKNIKKTISEVVKDVDCCIVRLPSVLGILAVQECIKQNKPWASEVVACCWDSLWNYGSIKGKMFAPIMYLLNKYYINKSTNVIYVSEQFLQERYPTRGKIGNASNVNIHLPNSTILQNRICKIKKMNRFNQIKLGLIGSLDVEYKGHRTAIYTLKELKEKGYNVILKCLGGGNEDKWRLLAKKLDVEDCIEFCGILPSGNPVLEWLDNIDIFIMPSLQEGLPRSMVEAMSRACPVIGARTGGIPELLQSKFIINKKDYHRLTQLVIELIENNEVSKQQAIRNFEEAKKYSKENIDKSRKIFWEEFKSDVEYKI